MQHLFYFIAALPRLHILRAAQRNIKTNHSSTRQEQTSLIFFPATLRFRRRRGFAVSSVTSSVTFTVPAVSACEVRAKSPKLIACPTRRCTRELSRCVRDPDETTRLLRRRASISTDDCTHAARAARARVTTRVLGNYSNRSRNSTRTTSAVVSIARLIAFIRSISLFCCETCAISTCYSLKATYLFTCNAFSALPITI